MQKIVINDTHGGFGLSNEAMRRYLDLQGIAYTEKESDYPFHGVNDFYTNDGKDFYYGNATRDDPLLVQVVEELGAKASAKYARLKIVEIPDDVEWSIKEYDGTEWVAEKHRTWG